jgi:hypothetical protein
MVWHLESRSHIFHYHYHHHLHGSATLRLLKHKGLYSELHFPSLVWSSSSALW